MTIEEIIEHEQQPIEEFSEKAYLDYAMTVILDRALPHIADGLKPVQRRIIYAMSELGLKSSAKYKKSARTIGDVLGKFHPHGDGACYEAMVLMAQSFSYRYPLVDGQGNWGSADDPKSFAAMRYTEARLSPYTETLLAECSQGTVTWQPNFDSTLEEPAQLPSRLPNILLNGTSGIAVGMATDIPSHNLKEITEACILLLDKPKSSLDDIMAHVPAPDFPTDAEIISSLEERKQVYETGQGSIRMRSVYHVEQNEIIITALPHQVSGNKVIEQIANQMLAKKLPSVVDLRDESDHENPTRLVVTPRSSRIDTDEIMQHLFATTDLERSYRFNLNIIGLNGLPEVKNLKKLLLEWLEYRLQTVRARLNFRLEQINKRRHLLAGLLIAFINLDEIIEIIRHEDNPKHEFITRFNLSEEQAHAILEIKLRQLAKLEEIKIREEDKRLSLEQKEIEKILGSDARLKTLIKKELKADSKTFGDARRSPIIERVAAQAIALTERITKEAITVILSEKGWIRSAKGHEIDATSLNYRSGDEFLAAAQTQNTSTLVLFDSHGRSYAFPALNLPSARSFGDPITSRIKLPVGAKIISMLNHDCPQMLLLSSSAGYGFLTNIENCITKNKNGKKILTVPAETIALPPVHYSEEQHTQLAILTNVGRLLVVPINEVPLLPKGKGNRLIQLKKNSDEAMIACLPFEDKGTIQVMSAKRALTLKPKDLKNYHGNRGSRGKQLPKGYRQATMLLPIT